MSVTRRIIPSVMAMRPSSSTSRSSKPCERANASALSVPITNAAVLYASANVGSAARTARRGVSVMPAAQMLRVAEPMAAYGGVTPVERVANGVDYNALAGVFVDPDEAMPAELVDALYLIDEMATPEGMEELLGLGDLVTLDDSQEQTPADVATQVFLRAPRLLERKHGEQFVGERTSFVYFLSEKEPTGKFVKPEEKKLEALQRNLGKWFLKKKKGDQVRVFVYPKEDEVWFLVRHGAGLQATYSRARGEIFSGRRGDRKR